MVETASAPPPTTISKEERNWAVLSHVSGPVAFAFGVCIVLVLAFVVLGRVFGELLTNASLLIACALIAAPIALGVLAPLIMWLIRKDEMTFAADQAKEALNFQITVFVAGLIAGVMCLVLIGFVLLGILVVVDLILMIVAAVKASEGVSYRYPFNLRLIS
ncbi:MAG TPA: DUF4870 domain-containing protein [Steroidobacteraceae bacterium]|nr:DUF4870 domain-containing protein [Steroidobacteraceae bacterium]